MKTLYLECNMGAAGDMLTGALLELLPEEKQEAVLDKLNHIGISGVTISREKTTKCGVQGTHVHVLVDGVEEESHDVEGIHHHEHPDHTHDHMHDEDHTHEHMHDHSHDDHFHDHMHDHTYDDHSHDHMHDHIHDEDHFHDDHAHAYAHHHTSMQDIRDEVRKMNLPDSVKNDILSVYGLIAEAESHAHGRKVEEIHFHEVGSKDAIMDVTAVCLLMHEIGAEQVIASPVHVGSGEVRCAHGIMPVPAPATEYLLRGIPSYQKEEIRGELCTPTGAALLRYFVEKFGPQPVMRVTAVGYGMGTKDYPVLNCVRAFLGETEDSDHTSDQKKTENASVSETENAGNAALTPDPCRVFELRADIDDMTAEEIGFAVDRLYEAGAREVFTSAINMKKNRPGTLLTVIADYQHEEAVVRALFRHTTTIGVRKFDCERYTLQRREETAHTPDGDIHVKISTGFGVGRQKAEYDDLARIAEKTGKTLREVRKEASIDA
jgi:uncharacterized protein (TIGR00299 family) protein